MELLRACLALLALLPLALARCPCPAAPAASNVCGSDHKTYDSQCHLDCAGVSAVHQGPCSPLEHAMSLPAAASVRDRPRRSAATNLVQCIENQTCRNSSCGCGASDAACRTECEISCLCGCLGRPWRGVGAAVSQCMARAEACRRGCQGGRGQGGRPETSACRTCVVHFIACSCRAGGTRRAARDTLSAPGDLFNFNKGVERVLQRERAVRVQTLQEMSPTLKKLNDDINNDNNNYKTNRKIYYGAGAGGGGALAAAFWRVCCCCGRRIADCINKEGSRSRDEERGLVQ